MSAIFVSHYHPRNFEGWAQTSSHFHKQITQQCPPYTSLCAQQCHWDSIKDPKFRRLNSSWQLVPIPSASLHSFPYLGYFPGNRSHKLHNFKAQHRQFLQTIYEPFASWCIAMSLHTVEHWANLKYYDSVKSSGAMKLKTPKTSLQKPIPPTQEVHLNLEGLAVSDETLLTFHSHLKKKTPPPDASEAGCMLHVLQLPGNWANIRKYLTICLERLVWLIVGISWHHGT